MSGRVGLILLAAGGSLRMGTPKQLLAFRGKPLVVHAAEVALAAACRPIVVVIGANADLLRPTMDGLDVYVVINDLWQHGMGTSIRAGLVCMDSDDVAGVIIALADQPFITAAHLDQLIALHHQSGKRIVASRYAGTLGVPAFFSRDLFASLADLQPDQGCKSIILAHPTDTVAIDYPDAAIDLDTPADYRRALSENFPSV